jgi:pyruvate/2-oxoacid:ferredoxin oxidoreductase alpha subunit
MEMRHDIEAGMRRVPERYTAAEEAFASVFGRRYGMLDAYRCEDAEVILAMAGTAVSTSRQVVDDLRARGEKVGVLKLRMFRPFPAALLASLVAGARKIAVLDRNFCFGVGGIFAQEIRSALYHAASRPPVYSYIAGLGGRDVTPGTIEEIYFRTKQADRPDPESVWVGLDPAACPVCPAD